MRLLLQVHSDLGLHCLREQSDLDLHCLREQSDLGLHQGSGKPEK